MQDAVTRISLRYLKEARILNFECIVGFVIRRSLYSDYDLVHKWTGILMASKKHIRILEQLVYDHVAQGMIVLVQGGNSELMCLAPWLSSSHRQKGEKTQR